MADAPDPVRAERIARPGLDVEGALFDDTAELVARQVAIWSYIFGAPEVSLAEGAVLDKDSRSPDGEPVVSSAIRDRALALRRQVTGAETAPPSVYTDYTLNLRVVEKSHRAYKVEAMLRERRARAPINGVPLQFFENDLPVAKVKTQAGRAPHQVKKPQRTVDVAVEWSVSKSAGKPLRVKQGTGPDVLLAESLVAPLRVEFQVDPSTFPKASDYLIGETLDWIEERAGTPGVVGVLLAFVLCTSVVGFSVGMTLGKRREASDVEP